MGNVRKRRAKEDREGERTMIGPKEVLTARDDEIIPNFLNWGRRVEQRLNKLETKTRELLHTKEELLNIRKTFEQLSESSHSDIRAMVKTDEINSLKERLQNTTQRLSEEINTLKKSLQNTKHRLCKTNHSLSEIELAASIITSLYSSQSYDTVVCRTSHYISHYH